MNPAQYKEAMRQRALERRAELSRVEAIPQHMLERSLGATHPPSKSSSRGQPRHDRLLVPELQVQGDDSEGGSAAISIASAAGGGELVAGFGGQDQVSRT